MYINRVLTNGIRIVVEKLPEIKSVTLGIWVKAGSVCESTQNNGISHFIEHMMFKGTERRSYKQIAEEMDNIGGQLNAFTGKECTCYYAKVIDEKQQVAIDVLCDMLVNSKFDEKEIEKENGVVIEEIAMNEDDPEDVAHERLTVNFFKGTEISKTILGPADNIRSLTREDIISYLTRNYVAENIVVVAVGNVDVSSLSEELENRLGDIPQSKAGHHEIVPNGWSPSPSFTKISKDTEQVNLCMGIKGYPYHDKRKYSMSVISSILGGSMSSRLFQTIREEQGAAYSVYSYPSVFTGAGMLSVYAGTSPEKVETVTRGILKEIKQFSISSEELANTKEQMRGSFILSQESMSAKMNAIGKSMLLQNDFLSEEKILSIISEISMDDIAEAVQYMFDLSCLTVVYVGNVSGISFDINALI